MHQEVNVLGNLLQS